MQTLTETTEINIFLHPDILAVSCDQPMPGPFPSLIQEKALGSRLIVNNKLYRGDSGSVLQN